jgi:YVTN family beta-propeller protein
MFGVTQAHAQTQTKAYLANGASNLVTVLDTSNDAVLNTIPVGASPSQVAVTKDGLRAYVSNSASNTVSVIDTATDAVIATIPVGAGPSVIAATPNGDFVYVVVSGGVDVVSALSMRLSPPELGDRHRHRHHSGWKPRLRCRRRCYRH